MWISKLRIQESAFLKLMGRGSSAETRSASIILWHRRNSQVGFHSPEDSPSTYLEFAIAAGAIISRDDTKHRICANRAEICALSRKFSFGIQSYQ